MQTPAAPASCRVGFRELSSSFRVSYLHRFQVRRQASSLYTSIVANDRVLPYPGPGKVKGKQPVKLKPPLFVALSALSFHQDGWLLCDKLWEQSCGCQEKRLLNTFHTPQTASTAWQRILKVMLQKLVTATLAETARQGKVNEWCSLLVYKLPPRCPRARHCICFGRAAYSQIQSCGCPWQFLSLNYWGQKMSYSSICIE